MKLTASELRAKENEIFDALEHSKSDTTFLGRLYRDGVPSPEIYLGQPVRVLFVFREPNMGDDAYAHDMRDEVSDVRFRPLQQDGTREDRPPTGWWNRKAGMFAHAVAAALATEPVAKAFARFREGGWNHDVANRFAYIQIKKVGGGGSSKAGEICSHAAKYAATLKEQIDLYEPHLVLGCGVGRDSPARLLAEHVLRGGRPAVTDYTKATWWKFEESARPSAMVQLWHPARRGAHAELYGDVFCSVREVVRKVGLEPQRQRPGLSRGTRPDTRCGS